MKKIFRLAIVFAIAGAALLTGCTKDYGVDIANLKKDVDELTSKVNSLQAAIDAGSVITNVVSDAEGCKIYVSGRTEPYVIKNGKDGQDGKNGTGTPGTPGSVITIQNGHWFIDGKDTGMDVTGPKGDPGTPGADGESWSIENKNGVLTFVSNKGKEVPVYAGGEPSGVIAVWDKDVLTLKNVDGAQDGIVTISLKANLNSIVTIPQFYYGGIEALYYHYLSGNYKKIDDVNNAGNGVDFEDQGQFNVPKRNTSANLATTYNIGAIETAEYHVNPQSYKFESEVDSWSFDCLNRDYLETKTPAVEWSAKVEGVTRKSADDNIAKVKFTVTGANKLNPSNNNVNPAEIVVSVLSLQAIDKVNTSKTVNSDYAAVVATKMEFNHLAFTKAYEAKTCEGDPVLAAPKNKRELWESAASAAANKASVEVKYNDGKFPLDFVGVHVKGEDDIKTLAQIQEQYPDLDLKYELIPYTVGNKTTSEDAYGDIDGKDFYPAFAQTDPNEQLGWKKVRINNANQNEGISAVGRRPIVLATLVDKAGNILLAGYFKIKISETAPVVVDPKVYGFDIKNFGEIGYACQVLGNETKWYDMSYQILENGLGITFNNFRKNYQWENGVTYVFTGSDLSKAKKSEFHKTTEVVNNKTPYNKGTVVYEKDNSQTGDNDITGVNDIFRLTVTKAQAELIGVGNTATLFAHFTNNATNDDVFIGLTFKISATPAVSFIKKNPVYWFNDVDVAADANTDLGKATIRNNVRVPLHWIPGENNSLPVTQFDKDIDDDWIENVVKIVKAGTTTEIAGATYKYRFSVNNKDIEVLGKKWTQNPNDKDHSLFWDGTEIITLTDQGVITFLCNDKSKKLINWATNPQEKEENAALAEHFLYCNVDIVATVPGQQANETCELLVETIHVRFLRPVYLTFDPQENYLVDGEATGSRVPFGTLFSARDWQNYPIFSYDKATKTYKKGYYPNEANKQVDWYDYYGFTQLTVDIDSVETDQKDPGSGKFESLKTVNPAAIVGVIDPANPTNPITQGQKVIDIAGDINNLNGWQFWYLNNMGYAKDFNLKVNVSLTYAWGSFTTTVTIPVYGTEHNYQQ